MKKKTFWMLFFLLVLIALFVWWFLFRNKTTETTDGTVEQPCLIFQNTDIKLPCFRQGLDISTSTSTNTSNLFIPKTPQNEAVYECFGENSIEANGCVSDIALEKKDSSLCSYVQGQYSQAQCKERITNPRSQIINTQAIETKISPLTSFTPQVSNIAPVIFTNDEVLKKISAYQKDLIDKAKNDIRFTTDGFYTRMQTEAPISLFSFSEYQMKPGTLVTANGTGFSKSGNIINIDNYQIANLSSLDGMTISFTLPTDTPLGNHEAWVTNDRGSSKKNNQPIKIIVTENPAPRPVIKSVTPVRPSINDRVTMYGENLSGIVGLYTSLGVLQNISSTDSSFSFNISDFEMVSKVKDIDSVKGQLVQVYVIVATDSGYNKDMFVFDVQF